MGKILLPKLGEHLIFCGTTGSGKTYLAERMLAQYDRTFVFDTHNSLNSVDGAKVKTPENLTLNLAIYSKIRYIPKLDYRTKTAFNFVVKKLMTERGGKNRVIYIDEIYHLGYAQSFPDWLARGISTARQRKTSLFISSQRPTNIPMSLLTEASRIFCFYLSYDEDIKKLSLFVRDSKNFKEEMLKQKYDYSFIEIDRIKGLWTKHQKLTT